MNKRVCLGHSFDTKVMSNETKPAVKHGNQLLMLTSQLRALWTVILNQVTNFTTILVQDTLTQRKRT